MLQLYANTLVLLATMPQDFRKGIDGFVAVCQGQLEQNPRDDIRFCFINRARTMVRILSWDGSGYWLMTKRLSKGKFKGWPTIDKPTSFMAAQQLRALLQGMGEKNEEIQKKFS